MLYFSAHWCPPCRKFTPKLIEFYKKLKSSDKNFELIFCSLDNDEGDYKEYISDMPWLCMPFEAEESKKLARKYKADGIPHLVVVDGTTGEVISADGVEEVQADSEGEKFPWKPKTFAEIWPDQIIADEESGGGMLDSSTIKSKYLMLYFSAHWCPPCKMFTPVLSEAYKKLKEERKEEDDFELVYVSSDRDEGSFAEYFKSMSFCGLPFEHRETKGKLSKMCDVQGIPSLVILSPMDENGERTIINKGVRAVIESGDFSDFPFHKKNYGALEHNIQDVSSKKSLIVFHEGGDDEEQAKTQKLLEDIAGQLKETQPEMLFLWSLNRQGVGPNIKKALKLPAMSEDACMAILDVEDDGAYYKIEAEVTPDNILKFIECPGDRHQLE